MKIFELGEITNDSNIEDIISFIELNCKPYLDENPEWLEKPLFRGVNGYTEKVSVHSYPINREPRDTNKLIHKILINAFKQAGFKANRDNSIFCSFNKETADTYSKAHNSNFVVFPIGNFDYCFSRSINDLYVKSRFWLEDKVNLDWDKPFITDQLVNDYVISNIRHSTRNADTNVSVPDIKNWFTSTNTLYSVNQILDIVSKNSGLELLPKKIIDGFPQKVLENFIETYGYDASEVNHIIKTEYQSNNLLEASDRKSEIMITGSKYLLVHIDLFYNLVKVKGLQNETQ